MRDRVDRLARFAIRLMLARYVMVSLVALCIDVTLFLALSQWVMPAVWAAFVGYALGVLVHWSLSVRFVFRAGALKPTHSQRASFALSALIGLAITTAMVSMLGSIGMVPAYAKAVAVVVSFTTVYLVRKHVVFAGA